MKCDILEVNFKEDKWMFLLFSNAKIGDNGPSTIFKGQNNVFTTHLSLFCLGTQGKKNKAYQLPTISN